MDSAPSACCLPPGVSRGRWAAELPGQRTEPFVKDCACQEVLGVKTHLPVQEMEEVRVRSWIGKIPWRRA